MGEWYLEPLFGTEPGYPGYLEKCLGQNPDLIMIDDAGRLRYKRDLEAILTLLPSLQTQIDEVEKLERIKICITNVIADIDSF